MRSIDYSKKNKKQLRGFGHVVKMPSGCPPVEVFQTCTTETAGVGMLSFPLGGAETAGKRRRGPRVVKKWMDGVLSEKCTCIFIKIKILLI